MLMIFKNVLTDKIGQALDDKRMTVANDWLNALNNRKKCSVYERFLNAAIETEQTQEPEETLK